MSRRSRDILGEFAERARPGARKGPDGVHRDGNAEHAVFMPPWYDGPHETVGYGPENRNAFDEARERHADGIEAGGLWDWADDVHDQARLARVLRHRPDLEEMHRFHAAEAYRFPRREAQVYQHYFADLEGLETVARRLRISVNSVKSVLVTLRNNLAIWVSTTRSTFVAGSPQVPVYSSTYPRKTA
jgi:hypothetical protein